jgi:hypothetical protein
VYMGPHWLAQHAHAKYIMGWSIVYGSELLSYVLYPKTGKTFTASYSISPGY